MSGDSYLDLEEETQLDRFTDFNYCFLTCQ